MRKEFLIACLDERNPTLKTVSGLVCNLKTEMGIKQIGFRYEHNGKSNYFGGYDDNIECIATEIENGMIVGISNNILNCAKEVKNNYSGGRIIINKKLKLIERCSKLIRLQNNALI